MITGLLVWFSLPGMPPGPTSLPCFQDLQEQPVPGDLADVEAQPWLTESNCGSDGLPGCHQLNLNLVMSGTVPLTFIS